MRRTLASFVVGVLAVTTAARAETLPRLHVTAFTLTDDARGLRAEQPFHILIDAHVRERISSLDTVGLPNFLTLEILGDEKRFIAESSGTDYHETITVVAHAGGKYSISSAYLDAIDARDGKPKRFLSNELVLDVAGPRVPETGNLLGTMLSLFAGILVVIGLAVGVARLRKPAVPRSLDAVVEDAIEPSSVPLGEPTFAEIAARARAALEVSPTRATAIGERAELWRAIGANSGETLADALRHPPAHDPLIRTVLRAIERAAFTHDADLAPAIQDAISALGTVSA